MFAIENLGGDFIKIKKGSIMNSNVTASRIQMNENEFNNLFEEVKEISLPTAAVKKFTTVDLWQIEKSRKKVTAFHRKWNLN